MSASINTKKGNVAVNYLKRAAGIVTGATGEYFQDAMPTTSSVTKEAASTVSQIHKQFAHTTQSVFPVLKQIRGQMGFKNLSKWFLSKSDEFDDNFDDMRSFDIDTDDVELAAAEISESTKNANKVAQAVVDSSYHMTEAQQLSTANIVHAVDSQTSVIAEGFKETNNTLSKILEVLTRNSATLIETVAAQERDHEKDMITSGRFNLNSYKKNVLKNFQNSELGILATIPSMLAGGTWKDILTPDNILGGLVKLGINKAAPKLKENMKALDDAVNNTIMTSLIRIGENSGWGIKGMFSKMFGIDASKKSVDTSRSSLELKAVPFDSISHEALTNVLPGYMRQILVHLGGPDLVYDYRARRFRSQGSIKRDFQNASTGGGGQIYSATGRIREGLGKNGIDSYDISLMYDLILNDLSSKTSGGEHRNIIKGFANRDLASKYVKDALGDVKWSKRDLQVQERLIDNMVELFQDKLAQVELGNQVASSEVTRQMRLSQYVKDANAYNVDLSNFEDSIKGQRKALAEMYGKTMKKDNSSRSEISESTSATKGLHGVDYSNRVLYEIYRRLDQGINVFQVGHKNIEKRPFKKMNAIRPPADYQPKNVAKNGSSVVDEASDLSAMMSGKYSDGTNLLQNQTNEDGTTENLRGSERFVRWGAKRGKDLAGAMFSGNKDDVKAAFGAIVGDVSQVASDQLKKGMSKINRSFGNVSGFLKHKMLGSEYSYETTDKDGNTITKTVKENKKGGVLGFINDEVKSMFGNAKEGASKWFKSVSSYFDFGDKDEDDPDGKIKSKRKKLISASVGALAGGGLLGGPIGLIMGGLAGSALSSMNLGTKFKNFLFGHDERTGKATGLISKVVDPIRFQIGKTVSLIGGTLKKSVLGPLSDIGLSIKDRIHNHVDSIFDKVKKTMNGALKKAGLAIFKGLSKAGSAIATGAQRIGITLGGKATRGGISAAGGMIEGLQKGIANHIAGRRSFHKLKKGEWYPLLVGERYLDPKDNERTIHSLADGDASDLPSVGPGARGIWLNGDNPDELMPETRKYLKWRRKQRKEEVDEDLKKSGYYGKGGIKGFFGGDYSEWQKKQAQLRRERAQRFKDATSETEMTPEESAAKVAEEAKKTREAIEKQAETSQQISGDTSKIVGEIIPGSSFKTYDQGIHDRLDRIISIITGHNPQSIDGTSPIAIETSGNEVEAEGVTLPDKSSAISLPTYEKENRKKENAEYGSSLVIAAAQAGDEGGYDDKDIQEIDSLDSASRRGESKGSLWQKFKKVLRHNKDKADAGEKEGEKKQESFLSKLFGGIGSVLLNNWPLILGGLALFIKPFREWLFNDVLPGVAGWLGENIPNIIGGIAGVGSSIVGGINQGIDNAVTGATSVQDTVTGDNKSVISAEKHAEDKSNVLGSSWGKASNLGSVAKGAVLREGARVVTGAGATLVQGSIANAAGLATSVKTGGGIIRRGLAGNAAFKNVMKLGKGPAVAGTTPLKIAEKAGSIRNMSKTILKPSNFFKNLTNPAALGNIFGGIATDVAASWSWEATETGKNANIVGDYGFGSAGGFVRTNSTVKGVTTFALSAAGGFAIGQAIAAAAGSASLFAVANGWNPVGWVAAVIAAVLAAAALLAHLVNLIAGWVTDKNNKDYAIRSNSSKLQGVIDGKVDYTNGRDNAQYVYCAQESDRALGFTKGICTPDPELTMQRFMKAIAENATSIPGSEVLLYDWINNMAVQGVPFACYVAGDSDDANIKGDQANTNSTGTPPSDHTDYSAGIIWASERTLVRKSTVKKNKDVIYDDIVKNIKRQCSDNTIWTFSNLEEIYNYGKEVITLLKGEGILNDKGEVQTKKFKNPPGDKKNAEGWEGLKNICKKKNSYFMQQCLVYINSKVEANKQGQQWIEVHKDDLTKLMESLKDVLTGESDAAKAKLKEQGLSDDEIEKTIKNATDPDGKKAVGAAKLADDDPIKIASTNTGLRASDQAEVKKELKYISAAYAYSHPEFLQGWIKTHQAESEVRIDDVDKIPYWKTAFNGDKRKQKTLRAGLIATALKFGEKAGDIYNLIPKFDWSSGGKIYNNDSKNELAKYGAAAVFRGSLAANGQGELDQFFEGNDPGEKTPEDVHRMLLGKKYHGQASEASKTGDMDLTVGGSGVIAKIANNILTYSSDEGESLAKPVDDDNPKAPRWKNVLAHMPASYPSNLPKGGDVSDDEVEKGHTSVIGGGNPLNKKFIISSSYDELRDLDGNGKYERHKGIDITPEDQSGKAEVGARFDGVISKVVTDVPDSHTGLDVTHHWHGNEVWIDTADGYRIKNFHLKAGSIPTTIKEGSKVKVGDKIGEMGSTGMSSGPHLHYQIEKPDDFDLDPTASLFEGKTMPRFQAGTTSTYPAADVLSKGHKAVSKSTPFKESEDKEKRTGIAGIMDNLASFGKSAFGKFTNKPDTTSKVSVSQTKQAAASGTTSNSSNSSSSSNSSGSSTNSSSTPNSSSAPSATPSSSPAAPGAGVAAAISQNNFVPTSNGTYLRLDEIVDSDEPAYTGISTIFREAGDVWRTGWHNGVDIFAPEGTPIRAAADGEVVDRQVSADYGYGNSVVIKHPNGVTTLYGHMVRAPAVNLGQAVKKGDIIGYVGNTGHSYGNHLHFSMKKDDGWNGSMNGFYDGELYDPIVECGRGSLKFGSNASSWIKDSSGQSRNIGDLNTYYPKLPETKGGDQASKISSQAMSYQTENRTKSRSGSQMPYKPSTARSPQRSTYTYKPNSYIQTSNHPAEAAGGGDPGLPNLDAVITVLAKMVEVLTDIKSNTSTSNEYLDIISEKDLVDKDLREALTKVGKNAKKKTMYPTTGSANQVISIARP